MASHVFTRRPFPIGVGLLALWVFFTSFPFAPGVPGLGLDPAWRMTLGRGLYEGRNFATELIFTFGPLGSPYTHDAWENLYPVTMAYWAVLLLALTAVVRVAVDSASPWRLLLATAPLLLPQTPDSVAFLFFFCVSLGLTKVVARPWLLGLIAVVAAMLALAKFTLFAVGAGVLAALTFSTWRRFEHRRWRALWIPCAWMVSTAALWLLARQPLADLPAYFHSRMEVASGYNGSMGLTGPPAVLWLAIASSVALMARCWMSGAAEQRWLSLLAGAFVVWVAFKGGFVREDGHCLHFVAFLAAAIAVAGPARASARLEPARLVELAAVALWVAFTVTALRAYPLWPGGDLPRALSHRLHDRWASALAWPVRIRFAQKVFREVLEKTAQQAPLPKLAGTADIASVNQDQLLASELPWSPRPVFQSYTAYTPWLAEVNAEHLRSEERAPRHFFVALAPIDDRAALQEDALLWPELLRRYDLVSFGATLRFDRRASPRTARETELALRESDGGWELPADARYDFVLLEALPTAALTDRLAGLVLRPPIRNFELTLANGDRRTHRAITTLQRTPFIVSPLINRSLDLARLSCGQALSAHRVVRFRFVDEQGQTVAVASPPRARAVELERTVSPCPPDEETNPTTRLEVLSGLDDLRKNPFVWENDQMLRNAHAPATLGFTSATEQLTVCLGVRGSEPWNHAEFDGVRFVVERVGALAAPLLDVTLGPSNPERRRCHTLALGPGEKQLLFRTEPNGTTVYDWAWWSLSEK